MRYAVGFAVCGAMLAMAGCHKNQVDTGAFKTTMNSYYSGKQDCVWPDAVKFPVQADKSNDEQTKGFDALTDAGLLQRTPQEKKRFLIGSKQVNDYDLTDKGRSTWTADPSQPGYGNFCFGTRSVTSIDSYSPMDNPDATQFTVSFHYAVTSAPDWAASAETKTAFPKIASDTSGQQTGSATLVKSENGWQVSQAQPSAGASSSGLVQ
ncbi:hypothetical protein [Paracidobacterium acidisoli]|nr:hypothetical protein [Paracidobacterium acidisoli]